MAIVSAEVRFAPQLTAWFTANPTKVLQDGEIVYCSDGANIGKYVIGDNSTQLSALTFYGGISSSGLTIGTTTITSGTNTRILYNNAGVVGEYLVTGTGTTAVLSTSPTFTTSVNMGAATASGRFLDIKQDTATWQIGSWTSSTGLAALYANGTPGTTNYILLTDGTASTYLNAPTTNLSLRVANTSMFDIWGLSTGNNNTFTFTPLTTTNQTLSTERNTVLFNAISRQWATGTVALNRDFLIKAPTYSAVGASVGTLVGNLVIEGAPISGTNWTSTETAAVLIQSKAVGTATTSYGILSNAQTGATTNYAIGAIGNSIFGGSIDAGTGGVRGFLYDGLSTLKIGSSVGTIGILDTNTGANFLYFRVVGNNYAQFGASQFAFGAPATASGATTNFIVNTTANTNQTLSTNIPNFKVTGSSKQWATGALATQYFNYFSANTVAFAGASTATNVYGLYVEAATAGTNATITNNYAAGFSGNVNIIGTPHVSGVAGVDGTFTTVDGKTVTVSKGLITAIV